MMDMMVKATVHISETIRCIVKDTPKTVVVEKQQPVTLRQVSMDIGIPPILVVFAIVDGVKKNLDDLIAGDVEIHFLGTMAGG